MLMEAKAMGIWKRDTKLNKNLFSKILVQIRVLSVLGSGY